MCIAELLLHAADEAAGVRALTVGPIHVVAALVRQKSEPYETLVGARLLPGDAYTIACEVARAHVTDSSARPGGVDDALADALDRAAEEAARDRRALAPIHALRALVARPDEALRAFIARVALPVERVLRLLGAVSTGPRTLKARPPTPLLDEVGRDLTAEARAGRLQRAIGRHAELQAMIRTLLLETKPNPALIGDAGVGKSALVEGLACLVVAPDAPAEIRDLRIIELSLSSLLTDTEYRGQMETKFKRVIEEATSDPALVLFVDEMHMLVGAGKVHGSNVDIGNLLKPELARGALRCIGATTQDEFQAHVATDEAFARRFHPIVIAEPSRGEAIEILRGVCRSLERHHDVAIDDNAVAAAVDLTTRYVPERRLPDKARDVLDLAAAACRLSTTRTVDREAVARVVSERTGIPVGRLSANREHRLARLEDELRTRVIGQDEAVEALAAAVRTAAVGFGDPRRPHGVFLFTGPTGVGKTELAKALAATLFESEDRLVRLDMSELLDDGAVAKLIGAPPGFRDSERGGLLTEAVRRNPYSIVLLDEIEKAHPRVIDLFLPIFDEGRMKDARGRLVDFRNTVIIMTSNLGVEREPAPAGFGVARMVREHDQLAGVRGRLRPELIARISRVIVFRALGRAHVTAIVDKLLGRVRDRLRERGLELVVEPAASEVLAAAGEHPELGARELERAIDRLVAQPLAKALLAGEVRGTSVTMTREGSRLAFRSLGG